MEIEVNNYIDSNLAREVTLGHATFWFANKRLMGIKHLHKVILREYSNGAFEGRCLRAISNIPHQKSDYSRRALTLMQNILPLYWAYDNDMPRIDSYAGKGAKAFSIVMGHAIIYFSNNMLVGFRAYDVEYKLDKHTMPSMKNHLANIEIENVVNRETLDAAFDKYFYMYMVKPI